jgi:hypothetical protein
MFGKRIAGFGLAAAVAAGLLFGGASIAQAGPILPIGPEQDAWSDMAFPTGVSGSYTSGTMAFTATASPSNDLELGAEFGPSNPGKHYGSGGTLGGSFSSTLAVNGVTVDSSGAVTNGGTLTIKLNGSAAGSIGPDYGISNGTDLLIGKVEEVLLDATGDNTLDVLFSISGGALQNLHPVLGIKFAPHNLGVLRFSGVTLPSNFSGNFSLNGATLDVLGVPEPSSIVLLGMTVIGAVAVGRRLRRIGL